MQKKYSTIEELIRDNLKNNEEAKTLQLIYELKDVKQRGYLTKNELYKIGKWKSPRPQKWYLQNTEEDIEAFTKAAFATDFEKGKICLLTGMKGIRIPAASAILMLTDPQNYGVIDIRVRELLYLYGTVTDNEKANNFSIENWCEYLGILRDLSKKFNVTARDIERTLFLHHQEIQEGNLYK